MIEGQKAVMPVKYRFFTRMFISTFCAWAIPHIAYRLGQLSLGPITITLSLNSFLLLGVGLAMVSGFGVGLFVSIMQWIALRPYIKSFWLWLISLELIWIAGDVLGYVIIVIQSRTIPYSRYEVEYTHSTLLRLVIVGLSTGLVIGILQQIFLQSRTGIRLWWGVAGVFGVFGGIFFEGANAAASSRYVTIDPIYSSILSGLVFASIASLPALLLKNQEAPDQPVSIAIPG
jgi:hypothetical protein